MTDGADRRWRAILTFLAVAYGLGWLAQALVARTLGTGPGGGPADRAIMMGLVAPALMWPPALAALVARRWVEQGGWSDSGLRLGPPRWLALGWVGPPVLVGLVLLASLPLAPLDPTFALMRSALEQAAAQAPGRPLPTLAPGQLVALQAASALTVGTAINALFAFGEELGWRGWLLPRLMARLGPGRGVAAHGALWGLWHAPLIALAGHNYPGHPWLGIALFTLFCTLAGVLLAWLTLASGSVLPATVAHASLNAVGGLPVLLLVPFDMAVAGVAWSAVGLLVLSGAVALLLARPRARAVLLEGPAPLSAPRRP